MNEPVWMEQEEVFFIQTEQIQFFGGSAGIREIGAILSAIERPKHLWAYGRPDIYDLAAGYTAGLCQTHGFVDGNKRTAFVVGDVFLKLNGHQIEAEQAEVVAVMLSLADHTLSAAGYGNWLREHVIPRP